MDLRSTQVQPRLLRSKAENHFDILKAGEVARSARVNQNSERTCRILVVDRDPMSGDLLASALVREMQFQASAIQAADLLQAVGANQVDLVVIAAELNQKVKSGFDLANSLSRACPGILIVMLLSSSDRDSVISAFRSGAVGVFSREQPMAEFLDCIDRVRRGRIWAGGQESDFLLQALRNMPAPNLSHCNNAPALTERELQVVRFAAMGKTNKIIASELRLSEHTVKNYLFRAFEKLGVSSRVELLFYLTLRGEAFDPAQPDHPKGEPEER